MKVSLGELARFRGTLKSGNFAAAADRIAEEERRDRERSEIVHASLAERLERALRDAPVPQFNPLRGSLLWGMSQAEVAEFEAKYPEFAKYMAWVRQSGKAP